MRSLQVKVISFAGKEITVYLHRIVETCSQCSSRLAVHPTAFSTVRDAFVKLFPTVFHVSACTEEQCGAIFLTEYELKAEPGNFVHYYERETLIAVPARPEVPEIPESVRTLSPRFVECYEQAYAAEILGLDQLIGGGLRKGLCDADSSRD